MVTSIEEISQVKRRLNVEIDAEDVTKKLDEAYKRISRRVTIKGFRPGKAPRRIIEQYYGKEIMDDVKSDLIKESFPKAIQESKLVVVGGPSIEDEAMIPGKNFKYTVTVEVRPDFELTDYRGISLEKEILNISEDDVDRKLEEIRDAHAKLISVNEDRGIEDGDYVIIDYEGFWKDKPLKGIHGKDIMVHVGSENFHPEFESGILGLKKQDSKDIAIDFNEGFRDRRLAGKAVTFCVHVQDIKRKELPELDDDFARALGANFKSLADLRKRVEKDITLQQERRIDRELKSRLLKKIAATVDFELPGAMVESEIERSIAQIKQNSLRTGTPLESAGISEERLRTELRRGAEQRVKEELVLGKIAAMEAIGIEESDIRKGFQELAAQTGNDPARLQEYYEKNNLMDQLRDQLLVEKILNHLVQGANIIEVDEISERDTGD
jgi:trigger factor